MPALLLPLLLATATAAAADAPSADTAPITCDNCAAWNTPRAPFRLHGDSWYVGTEGLASVLVATPDGLVLIDGALPQSAPLIAANVESLGFRMDQVRWLLNSHPHYDHAGGLAALQRLSGAPVASSARGAEALRAGRLPLDDPQQGFGAVETGFPPVADVRVLADGEAITLGGVRFTLVETPGHAPGGTSWTWRSCAGDDCRDLVYADSLTAVSAPGFRFRDHPAHVERLRASIARIAALPCDLVVSAHPGFTDLFERQAARTADPGIELAEPGACRAYAGGGEAWLSRRLASEDASP